MSTPSELVPLGKKKQTAPTENITVGPFAGSRKVFVEGKLHPSVRVPMREISLKAPNEPLRVYDTSGPFTDPSLTVDVRQGIAAVRSEWITGRGDVEELSGITFCHQLARLKT